MSSFQQHQQQYVAGLNHSIPTLHVVDNATIERALAGVDPEMPATFSVTNTANRFTNLSEVAKKDAACRNFGSPSASMRGADAKIGCGWWYVPDTSYAQGTSVGAYGTRRGQVNSTIDKEYGQGRWIWDINEARKQEAMKVASRVKSCQDLQLYTSPEVPLGWCPVTRRAIVLTADGSAAFPREQACPRETIIQDSRNCPVPTQANGMGSAGGVCGTQPLSPACLQAVITAAGCSARGPLFDSLNSGRPTESQVFNSVYQYVTDGGFSLNNGILTDGNLSVESALQSIKGLKGTANLNTSNLSDQAKLSILASKNLCYGTAFDPCNILDSKTQPYDLQCIRKLGISMGYSSNGTLLSNGASYWNKFATWKHVKDHLASFKQYADTGPILAEQVAAIRNVYGVSVSPPTPTCIINSIPTLALWLDAADPHGNGAVPANNEVISTWVNKAGLRQYDANAVKTDARFNVRGGAVYSSDKKGLRMDKNLYETNYPANPATETVFIVCSTNVPSGSPYNAAIISGRQGARGIWAGYTDSGGANRDSPVQGTVGVLSSDVHWLGTTPAGSYKYGETTIATVQFESIQPPFPRATISLNGSAPTVGVLNVPFTAGTTTTIGQQLGAGYTAYNFDGYVMEIIIFKSVLAPVQVQQVEGYLAWKWGLSKRLPYGHPYKARAP